MTMVMTPDRIQQLKELSSLDWKELNNLKQLYSKYYGYWSPEVKLFNIEIRRRKALRPDYKLAVENLRRLVKQHTIEIKRLDKLKFKAEALYHPITLNHLTFKDKCDTELTGKAAYRIACERIRWLELNIAQLEEHIHIIQLGQQVTGITMDLLESYNINKLDKYRSELNSRLNNLKCTFFPGTNRVMPAIYRHSIPVPEKNLGPRPGDTLQCISTKNYKAGAYQIVLGGVGFNRYYCRKLLEELEPEPGYLLFAASYAGGYGHYVITVPRDCCKEAAFNYIFTKDRNKVGYYEARRSVLSEYYEP